MSWHYQIQKCVDEGQLTKARFEIAEVYLDDKGTMFGHTDGIKPMGQTAEELIADLEHMLVDAKHHPILVDLPDTEEDV